MLIANSSANRQATAEAEAEIGNFQTPPFFFFDLIGDQSAIPATATDEMQAIKILKSFRLDNSSAKRYVIELLAETPQLY